MHMRCSGTVDEFQENSLTLLARCDDINEKKQIAILSTGLPPRWALTSTYRSLLLLMMPCPWHGLSSAAWRWPTTQLVSCRAAHARCRVSQVPLLRLPNPM
jgi:hypothetical protein